MMNLMTGLLGLGGHLGGTEFRDSLNQVFGDRPGKRVFRGPCGLLSGRGDHSFRPLTVGRATFHSVVLIPVA